MNSPVELVSIDAYGTIFDMTPVYHQATTRIVDQLAPGFPVRRLSTTWTARFMEHYHAQTEADLPPTPFPTITDLTRESFRATLAELGLAGDPDLGTAIWVEHLRTIALYDDVAPALAALSARFRLVLTSDSDAHIIQPALDRYTLPFEHHFVSETLQTYKMSKQAGLLEVALRRLEVDPARVVHVGDSEADLLAAERAGCRGVWINRPGHTPPKRQPWRTIHSLLELTDL